ncbi:class I SAM-dependent methyltransferase [Anaerovibrio sp.]|uniref:class I SAM-dependent methyltransferase n=1 Tax=Anaerovibrio sp. TaxID=1872532 RepID=UPI003F175738
MKIKLNGVEETMLIPLWCRAHETTAKERPLIQDDMAVQIVQRIDYNFEQFASSKMSQTGVAVRSSILDKAAGDFFLQYPDAVCINLACGLDTRFYRLDNGQIDWYDIDLPDVMAVRQQLIPDSNPRLHSITGSILEEQWTAFIDTANRPVLIIMEGAAMYFSEDEMKLLFQILSSHFMPATMLIEVMPPFVIKNQKHHDAVDKQKAPFKWGINDGRKITALHPDIKFEWQQTLYDGYRRHWGIFGLLSLIPWWNHNVNDKIVQLKLSS